MIDIEMASDAILNSGLEKARKLRKKVILSYHDFESIPSQEKVNELTDVFEKRKGDILKVA